MKGLTARQEEILRYLIAFTRGRHYQPNYREIGNRFNITSTQGVSDHIKALHRKGYIKVTGQSRAIRISDDVWDRY